MWLLGALGAFAALALGVALGMSLVKRSVVHGPSAAEKSLRAENEALKSRVAVLERSEQVAKAALADVQQVLRERAEEADSLRSDLAFYGRLVGGQQREGLAVHQIRVRPVAGSLAWNFTATLTQNFKRGQETRGRLSLSVEGVEDGKLKTLDWNTLKQNGGAAGIEYAFKYFQQVNGTIMLPQGFEPNRIRVRAEGEGGRAEQDFNWQDALEGEEKTDVQQ